MKNEHRKMPGRSAVDCLTRSVLGIKEKRLATSPSALLKRAHQTLRGTRF